MSHNVVDPSACFGAPKIFHGNLAEHPESAHGNQKDRQGNTLNLFVVIRKMDRENSEHFHGDLLDGQGVGKCRAWA